MSVKTRIGIETDDGKIIGYNGNVYSEKDIALIERNILTNTSYILSSDIASKSDASHRLVMFTVIDNIRYCFEFDMVTNVSISTRSEITEHPLVNGDTIADHMYRLPATMTVTGKFSLQGNQRYPYNGASERLANIETIFERIKTEGLTSTLMTISGNNETSARFKVRENMVLSSITWNEHLNSVDFDFTFNEVLQADVQSVTYEEDITDPDLPALTDASSLSFTDVLLDWDSVDKLMLKELLSINAVTDEFLQYACDYAKNLAITTAVGTATGVVTGLIVLKGIAIACGSIPVWGWIVGAVIVGVGLIIGALISIYNQAKNEQKRKEYKIRQYRLYKDDRKNQQEVEDFANYVGNVHKSLEYLNDVIQVYGLTTSEQQECMTYIDDNYYIFRFMKNNVDGTWTLTVLDTEDNVQGQPMTCNSSALGSIAECTRSNFIFRTKTGGFYVYLINKQYVALANNNASQEEFDKAALDLTNYYIVVSQTDMDEFNQMLSEIVLNAMKM